MSVDQAKPVTDLFSSKFYPLIQNTINLNIGEGLNFGTCEQTFKLLHHTQHSHIRFHFLASFDVNTPEVLRQYRNKYDQTATLTAHCNIT